MHERGCACRAPLAAAMVLLIAVASAGSAFASDESENDNAEVAGLRAHFAQEFCGTSPERIGHYKERLRKASPDATEFERRWQAGWHREEDDVYQMRALRGNDPAGFAARVKRDCSLLKWQAENSVKARPAR